MGGRLCYAVYPGDAATALDPVRRRVTLATPPAREELSSSNWSPAICWWTAASSRMSSRSNEILTEVVMPAPKPGWCGTFEKLRPRGVWDFAMASLALNLQFEGGKPGGTDQGARVVFGGIAAAP